MRNRGKFEVLNVLKNERRTHMKLTGVVLLPLAVACAFHAPLLRTPQGVARNRALSHCFHSKRASTDEWVALPVNPSAGKLSRTASFSPSDLEDLRAVEHILELDNADDACVVVIPSWRHHVVQYDRLSAALESFKVPTAVFPLRDGLWAFLLQRLQVNALRRAARKGTLKETIVDALERPFAHLDLALRNHSGRNHGRRISIIASDDSAWLVRAFVNSRSTEWLAEVPLATAVLVGGYHKSIVGELALDVYPHRPQAHEGDQDSSPQDERGVKFFSLNGREGGRAEQGGEAVDLEASISCMSFEEDSESCILQEYEVEDRSCLSLLGSTSLLSLWVPRVLRG